MGVGQRLAGPWHGPLAVVLLPAVLAGCVLLADPAEAKEVNGIWRLQWTETSEPSREDESLGTTLDVRWNRPVSSFTSYLFSLRYTTSRRESLFDMDQLEGADTQIEPRLEFRVNPRTYSFTFGDRFIRTRNDIEGAPENVRDENNLFGNFRTLFEERPNVFVDFDRRDVSIAGVPDQSRYRVQAQISYAKPWWTVSGGRRHTVEETDPRRRQIDENLFSASLNRLLADGELSVFASYNLNDLDEQDRLERETLVPIPRAVRLGLLGLDATPLDGTLAQEPRLIDGDRSGATAANIGGGLAGGQTGWNLGVELVLRDPVDVADVWLSQPIPAENAMRYQWEVYASEDNLTWTLVSGSATRQYDEFDGRFRLIFTPVTARFVKVVNGTVDDTLGAVFVSEIEVFGRELRRGTTEASSRVENASSTLTWSPTQRFSATLSGFRGEFESEREGQRTATTDTTGSLTLSFRPSDVLLGSLSAITSRRSGARPESETDRTYSLSLTALPLRDLEMTVVGSFRELERGSASAPVDSFLFRVATLLYRDLSLSADYSEAHEENLDAPTRNRQTIRASLDTRPREELTFNTTILSERLETPSLPPGQRVQRIVDWRNRLSVRPSSMFNIVLEADYFDLPEDDGWSQVVQLDWLPFAGGALQLSLSYREDLPLLGLDRTVRVVGLRWNLNRQMFLDLDAIRQRTERVDLPDELRTVLSAFLQVRF